MKNNLDKSSVDEQNDTIIPIVSDDEVDKIRNELVEQSIYRDVKYNINGKSRLKFIADLTETLAHIIIVIGSILAFASGSFNIFYLSFVAGSCNVISVSLLRFSSYAMRESRERTVQVNMILRKIGIGTIPDIAIDSTENDFSMDKKKIHKLDK